MLLVGRESGTVRGPPQRPAPPSLLLPLPVSLLYTVRGLPQPEAKARRSALRAASCGFVPRGAVASCR
jgi:hypothetical protein